MLKIPLQSRRDDRAWFAVAGIGLSILLGLCAFSPAALMANGGGFWPIIFIPAIPAALGYFAAGPRSFQTRLSIFIGVIVLPLTFAPPAGVFLLLVFGVPWARMLRATQ